MSIAFAQDTKEIAGQLAQVYTGSSGGSGLLGGFSTAGLIWTVIFNGLGFIAFTYGKKNSEMKPMLLGIALMAYPYFVRSTNMILIVGTVLTAALYFWRD